MQQHNKHHINVMLNGTGAPKDFNELLVIATGLYIIYKQQRQHSADDIVPELHLKSTMIYYLRIFLFCVRVNDVPVESFDSVTVFSD